MADQTQGSIQIDATPAGIMAEINDFEAYPEWASEIKKVEIQSKDSMGRANRVYYEVSNGPLKADYVLEYSYDANDGGVKWTFVEGHNIRNLEGSYTLEPAGTSTKVTYTVKVEASIPMLGFMKRQVEKRIIDVGLKGLKKRVESKH